MIPFKERNQMREDFMFRLVGHRDIHCIDMLRLDQDQFFSFCTMFRERGLLVDMPQVFIEEQVAMFLYTLYHSFQNRAI